MGHTYSAEDRYRCELDYCLEGKSIQEISRTRGVSETTLYRWRTDDEWDERVKARVMSGPMLAREFVQQMGRIVKQANQDGRILDKGEVDQLAKLGKLADQYDPAARFRAHALDTIDQLMTWLSERDPDLRDALIPLVVEFTREVVRNPTV